MTEFCVKMKNIAVEFLPKVLDIKLTTSTVSSIAIS